MTSVRKSFFPAWLRSQVQDNEVVISSRIRLARNIQDFHFPPAASHAEKNQVLKYSEEFINRSTSWRTPFHPLQELDPIHRQVLAERGLIDMKSVQIPRDIGLAIGPGQIASLLVNEEDHFRVQVMLAGLQLHTGLNMAQRLENDLAGRFHLAHHPRFGFLTVCPSNVGSGLRASVMLHLPGLALNGDIAQVLSHVLRMGLTVRGFYGETSTVRSVYFQVSNQITLGRSETELVNHMTGLVNQIIERERSAREALMSQAQHLLEDKVGRALGVLTGCCCLGFEEALEWISALRLGAEVGLAPEWHETGWNELLLLIQPAHIQLLAEKPLDADEQNIRRAQLVQKRLKLNTRKFHL